MLILLTVMTLLLPASQTATPGEIDPMDTSAGDFLDLDLTEYLETAADAYRNGNLQ